MKIIVMDENDNKKQELVVDEKEFAIAWYALQAALVQKNGK